MTTPKHFLVTTFVVAMSVNTVSLKAALVDPTRPPSWGSATVAPRATARRRGLQLQTTLVSPSRRMAIINGRSYSIGSRIGTATIIEIKPFEVTLQKAGKKTRLRLLPRVTRTPPVANKDKK